MPTLHVRNVPSTLYERIKQRAHAENRSLSAEVIFLLDHALGETAVSQTQLLERIRQSRTYKPSNASAPDSTTLLREDRER